MSHLSSMVSLLKLLQLATASDINKFWIKNRSTIYQTPLKQLCQLRQIVYFFGIVATQTDTVQTFEKIHHINMVRWTYKKIHPSFIPDSKWHKHPQTNTNERSLCCLSFVLEEIIIQQTRQSQHENNNNHMSSFSLQCKSLVGCIFTPLNPWRYTYLFYSTSLCFLCSSIWW